MKRSIPLLLVLSLLLFTTVCKGQTGVDDPSFYHVDSLIEDFTQKYSIGAASVAITKDGNLVYNRSFGFSDLAKTDSAKPYDRYRIMSLSKQYTSIAIMQLVQNDTLRLDDRVFADTIHQVPGIFELPCYRYYLDAIHDTNIYRITVRQLLEHNAGWDRDLPCDGFSSCDPHTFPLHVAKALNEPSPIGDSALIKFLLVKGLDHEPGLKYAYSNVGYLILGKIIEKISGSKYDDYITKNIFGPNHIDDIRLGDTTLKQEREVEYEGNQTSLSYSGGGGNVSVQYGGFNMKNMNSFGGWIATAEDMVKVLVSVDKKHPTNPPVLSNDMIDTMTKPSRIHPGYAKGWEINGDTAWSHNGRENGTATEQIVTRGAKDGYTCAILFNRRVHTDDFDAGQYNLGWQCIKIVDSLSKLVNPSSKESLLSSKYNLFPPDANAVVSAPIIASITSASVSCTHGSGNGRMIIAYEADSVNDAFTDGATNIDSIKGFPVDGRDYTPNNIYGRGSYLGHNCYVVYNNTGISDTTVTVEGLNPLKTYTFTAIEYKKTAETNNHPVYKYGNRTTVSICTSPYKHTQ